MTDSAATDVADDLILSGQILRGVRVLRDHLGCPLHEALKAFTDRYDVLRAQRPDDFTAAHDDYWAGFHS